MRALRLLLAALICLGLLYPTTTGAQEVEPAPSPDSASDFDHGTWSTTEAAASQDPDGDFDHATWGTTTTTGARNSPMWNELSTEERSTSLAAGTTCKTIVTLYKAFGPFNNELFVWGQKSYWCFKQGTITLRISSAHVDCCFPLWKYNGVIHSSSSGATNPWIRYRQAEFEHYFMMPWGAVPIEYQRPWVQHTMYANGTYKVAKGT